MNKEDENGYERGKYKHSDLIHRQVAYNEIYLKNRSKYRLPFSKYIVHHKDGDKKNNVKSNLQIMKQGEHEKVHGIMNTKKDKDLFNFEERARNIPLDYSSKVDWNIPKKREVKKQSKGKKRIFRTNKNLSKTLLVILIISIFLFPIIVNQHSLYLVKTMDNEDLIQKCADDGFVIREKCEEIFLKLEEEFLESYERVPFTKKYQQGVIDSFSYQRYWYSWIIPIILFLVYLKIRKKK